MKTLVTVFFILLISTAVAIPFLGFHGSKGRKRPYSKFHAYDGSVVYDEKDNKVIEWFFHFAFF